MKNTTVKVISFFAVATLIISCERKDPEPTTPVNIGGKGGSSSITAIPKHHSKYIDSCTMYIKYNTLDLPSPNFNASQYDEAIKCTKLNDSVWAATFTQLKKGNYYIVGYGWDKNILDTVFGGKPFTINADSAYQITVSVTEGD